MTCVYPKCNGSVRTRGLCHGHYQAMRTKVREGKATEEDLMRRKLLKPKMSGRRSLDSHNAFNVGSDVTGDA